MNSLRSRPWFRYVTIFTNGLVVENPLLVLMIGLCSSLAVTTSTANGIGMGFSMTFVLLMSEMVISLCKKIIPDSIRIPIFIIVVAAFTTIIDYVLKAWFPELSRAMGIFIPLIVVNCIIMGRVEGFAFRRPVGEVIPDALGMGLGFTWVLVGIAAVRELLGNGTIMNIHILPLSYEPILFFVLAPGGFFVFSLFVALNLAVKSRITSRADTPAESGCAGCSGCGISEQKGGQP